MCKKRIETAAYGIAGVKSAVWSSKTQSLTVSYDSKKANNEAIQKRVAAIGHDTEKVKAADTAYGKLPDCCKYRDGVEVHDN
jgi:copper chaperone CopZ